MYIPRYRLRMVDWRMMFCKIISVIVLPAVPIYSKLLKHLLVSQPVPFHIPCFWKFWFHARFHKSFCRIIVGFEGCWWLFVVQYNLLWSYADICFTVFEGSTCFSVCRWWYNIAECFALCVNRTVSFGVRIYWLWWWPITQIEMFSITNSCLCNDEIYHVWIHM